MEPVGHRKKAAHQAHDDALVRIGVLGVEKEHLYRGKDQECGEDVKNPVELRDQLCPDTNHRTAQDQRPKNAPEQHPVLIDRRHREEAEEHRDHEDVIDAEGLLDNIAGQVFLRRRCAAVRQTIDRIHHRAEAEPLARIREVHENRKRQSHGNPHGRPAQCLPDTDDVGLAVKDTQVQCQHEQHKRNKSYPDRNHSLFASVIVLNFSLVV